jgi:hypothetical protein
MTVLSNWSSEVPSGSSLIRKGDDQIRSEKSVEYEAWEEGHYWDSGSAASGGQHDASIGLSSLPSVGTPSTFSAMGDTGRLFYDSDRTALAYVGVEGVVEPGLPSPYQSYFLSDHTMAEQRGSSPSGVRLPHGKVWVMSVLTVPAPNTGSSNLTRYSWFTGASADLVPYDGVPMFMISAASVPAVSGNEMSWWEVRLGTTQSGSWDSSGFTPEGTAFRPNQISSPAEMADEGGYLTVLSIGSMDASRIS